MTVLRREGMPEVPFGIELCPSQLERFQRETGETDVAAWFRFMHRYVHSSLVATADPRALYAEQLPDDTKFDVWGVARSAGSAEAMHMRRLHTPLCGEVTLEQIADYPMARLADDAEAAARAQVGAVHEQGYAAIGGMAGTVWERSWSIRSMEDLMIDMLNEDERATLLLDRVTDVSVARAEVFARADCDIIHLGDDIGMQRTPMMSIPMWRQWLRPRLARVIAAAKAIKPDAMIFYHSCGFVLPFLDDLIEVGVEILNPVQPECFSFEEVHERYGDRLSFWGTVGTQTTMPFGSPEEVREVVFRNVGRCRETGGLAIAPTHLVEPEVPWENIVALRRACDEVLVG